MQDVACGSITRNGYLICFYPPHHIKWNLNVNYLKKRKKKSPDYRKNKYLGCYRMDDFTFIVCFSYYSDCYLGMLEAHSNFEGFGLYILLPSPNNIHDTHTIFRSIREWSRWIESNCVIYIRNSLI